jgi:hypothetical protein
MDVSTYDAGMLQQKTPCISAKQQLQRQQRQQHAKDSTQHYLTRDCMFPPYIDISLR